MVIEVPQTSLAVRLAEIRFPIGRLAHGNRLATGRKFGQQSRRRSWREQFGPAEPVLVTEVVVLALAAGREEAEQIE